MKLLNNESQIIIIIILFAVVYSSEFTKSSIKNIASKPVAESDLSKDDKVLNRIQEYIFKYADRISKGSDLKLKRKINGQLTDKYPKIMVKNAQKNRLNRDYWSKLLSYPTEVWRICVYPEYMFKLNVMNWCDQKYGNKHPKKLTSCKNTFCTVCCDHLQIVLKNQAEKEVLGEMLLLQNNPGFSKITQSITDKDLKTCKHTCSTTYPISFPVVLPPPPRDNKLGHNAENAAKNCGDIQKWGAENSRSGEYWIELGQRGKTKIFCDMETDFGGWMLFFNYLHYPGQEVSLDMSKVPSNLKQNSHVNLKEIGISENEISELRFFCTERSNNKLFWHFKISNQDIINVALSGDQRYIKRNSIQGGYNDLPFPGKASKWIRIMDKDRIRSLDYSGNNRSGGLWDSPFGSNKLKKFWTVKGNVKKGGRFECGTNHKDNLTNPAAQLIMTHHTVWVRGVAPDMDEARSRFTSRNAILN